MTVTTLPNSAGGYVAAIDFHDGRQLIHGPIFRTADAARDFGENWIRQAVASYARTLASSGLHIQPVKG